ncbi:MAG TPA: hypothetical protein VK548_02045 [Candidatus Acidoferrum sp.]|nr:hypothetical protein [Candidatus Acidoferrum sp.]
MPSMISDRRVTLGDLSTAARFVGALPGFLRSPLDPATARRTVAGRLEWRESDFIDHLKLAVYEAPANPYRELLRWAGCEHGDLARLARADGVESTLRTLCRAGVYLTVGEFKGRQPVVRGGSTLHVDPVRLRNPRARPQIQARSGGSRSAGTPVVFDLDFVRGCAADTLLFLEARGAGPRWRHGDWEVPGGASIFRLLKFAAFGRVARWFTQVDAADPGLHPRYRWSGRLLRATGALCGAPFPPPEHVPVEDPRPIARWMREVLDGGEIPHIYTFASSAVRLCQGALADGIDLAGAQITLIGEPVTSPRLQIVRRAGAIGVTRYATTETGPIAYGCLAPAAPDDVHVVRDLQAVIQPGANDLGLDERSLLITSLHPAAPFVLVNVAMGDVATLAERACGCPLARLGWATHLEGIRSYEKLTAGGMNFLDVDVVRILEEVLPTRFGGAPTDYQLVETADADGRPRLGLVVHPRLGPLDADEIARTFLAAIGAGTSAERVGGLVWQAGRLVRVERRVPLTTQAGKILHLHAQAGPA